MQDGRVRTILRQIVGRAIVKAHAYGKDHIGMMHRHVGFIGAVHTQHTQCLTVGSGKCPQSHQRRCNRKVKLFNEFTQLDLAGSIDRAATNIDNRFFSCQKRLQRALNLTFMALRGWVVGTHAHRFRPDVRQFVGRVQDIFRQIDHDRTRTPACRQPEGFFSTPGMSSVCLTRSCASPRDAKSQPYRTPETHRSQSVRSPPARRGSPAE